MTRHSKPVRFARLAVIGWLGCAGAFTACGAGGPMPGDIDASTASKADADLDVPDTSKADSNQEVLDIPAADATAPDALSKYTDVHWIPTLPCGPCAAGEVCVAGTSMCETEMAVIPAGIFRMGCWGIGAGCYDDPYAKPAHDVDVPAYAIDRLETTNADYAACVAVGGCSLPTNMGYYSSWDLNGIVPQAIFDPVMDLTWDEASRYCQWRQKRLCTEAEWEKAARGTDGRRYPWGNAPHTCLYAEGWGNQDDPDTNCLDPYPYMPEELCRPGCGLGRWTNPVGTHPLGASPYGVYDMTGNASEWVEDYYHDGYVGAPTDGSAWLVPKTGWRVRRDDSEVFFRMGVDPVTGFAFMGIRCCRDVPAAAPQ